MPTKSKTSKKGGSSFGYVEQFNYPLSSCYNSQKNQVKAGWHSGGAGIDQTNTDSSEFAWGNRYSNKEMNGGKILPNGTSNGMNNISGTNSGMKNMSDMMNNTSRMNNTNTPKNVKLANTNAERLEKYIRNMYAQQKAEFSVNLKGNKKVVEVKFTAKKPNNDLSKNTFEIIDPSNDAILYQSTTNVNNSTNQSVNKNSTEIGKLIRKLIQMDVPVSAVINNGIPPTGNGNRTGNGTGNGKTNRNQNSSTKNETSFLDGIIPGM